MLEVIWESVQPFAAVIIKDVITFVVAGALIAYGLLKTKILTYIKNEMLHRIATEAFSLAETKYKDLSGNGKLGQAYAYASDKLGRLGIKVSAKEIEAAIEKACLDYNATKKKIVVDKAS